MEHELEQKVRKSIQLADHLLIATYPLVKDPKLLLGVLTNIEEAYTIIILIALSKKAQPLKTKQARLEQFNYHFKKEITTEELQSIKEIHALVEEHKKSSVEFARKQQLVMCNNHYEFKALTFETLKKHLQYAKSIQKKLLLLL